MNISEKKDSPKIGVFGVGYEKYWEQFPGLFEELMEKHAVIIKKIPLPKMTREELEESIQWEAEQFIPFDMADVFSPVRLAAYDLDSTVTAIEVDDRYLYLACEEPEKLAKEKKVGLFIVLNYIF